MRLRRAMTLIPLAFALHGVARADDFDPRGRHHGPAHAAPTHASPSPGPAPPTPVTSPAVLIDRYTKIVLAQPGAPFPLQRLAQLYRDRDGKLDALLADLTARSKVKGADQYAATVALGGLLNVDGHADEAIAAYTAAAALRPNDAAAPLALAHLYQDRGDLQPARTQFERALALQTVPTDRAATRQALLTLALDAKDWDAAERVHAELVRAEPNSLFVKGELGRELYARGEYVRAEAQFKDVVTAATGDNRALAPALKDLGQAQAKAHENAAALATLERGLAVAGSAAAVRGEIYQTITEIYREEQTLPLFVKKLEEQHPGDYARLALLGSLYEETGDAKRALATYQRALAIEPRQIDLRLKMIRLLQAEGELEQAIGAYEALIRAQPGNPQFVFELCDALLQRGERTRALGLLSALEARSGTDEEVLSRLGEFYTRIGEGERAVRVLAKLAATGGSDPSHLADLGDHYFQEGNTALAVTTWKRILTTVTPRARALAALGDVYADHDLLPDAVAAFKEATALEPANLGYKKGLAAALEKNQAYREAGVLWEALADRARQTRDLGLAREVRTHLVTLWSLEHTLEQRVPRLEHAFGVVPPDVEAGRTLADVWLHLRRLPEAEATLRHVLELAPGDVESYLALERVLVQEQKQGDAIAVLLRLVEVDPKRARETYQRMAQYALQIYRDADAITYAARAVALNPDDAEGHRRLGDMYKQRQDEEHAIVEYRAAIAKNDRLYLVYFELADLLLSKGETDEADRLFRRVLRSAPDEELVARAARLSMQINLGKGTLASLEQDLVPLAIGNPQKSIYRKLLVELYGNLTFGLVERVRHGTGKDEETARAALAKVGQRAVKPLLDALGDGDGGQQRVALDVLEYVANKNAGPALFGFATGNADTALRVRAMIACGALRDPALLPRYEAYLVPKGPLGLAALPTDALATTATWGVARMNDPRALPLLRTLAKSGSPDTRALAVLGLGALGDRASLPLVTRVAKALDAGDVARAAAAYALGELGDAGATPVLVTLAEDGDALPRQLALLSLARLANGHASALGTKGDAALAAMADAVFAGGDPDSAHARALRESLVHAGAAALITMAGASVDASPSSRANHETFPVPDTSVQVEPLLAALVPTDFTAEARAAAVVTYASILERAARIALETSADRARTVLAALGEGNGALEPFLGPEESAATARARAKVRALVTSLEPSLVPLVRHPDPLVRTAALALLSGSTSDAATGAIVLGLTDADDAVVRVALGAVSAHGSAEAAHAREGAARILKTHADWSLRALAADALARIGAGASPFVAREAARDLGEAALHDPFALVREAALHALAKLDPRAARDVAARVMNTDEEPRVREAARVLALAAPANAAGGAPP